ncbi:MAG: mannose-1-phosphate guanylyltransferase [Kiritimatiellae bacterium]|nr:mannose-1-phosphate guanylyltransferase [Kiritimatiellia bacterium]
MEHMNEHLFAVIMAGGGGERLWPVSTPERPKQFVTLFGGKALLRHAVDRLEGLVPPERTFVVTARSLEEATAEVCPALPRGNIVGEPMRRDTAAAAALACGLVAARDPDGIALLLTADHIIGREEIFRETLADAAEVAAREECIVTIGIEPTYPATGYGYIEAGDPVACPAGEGGGAKFRRARRFVEKPDAATASNYLAHGGFYWNSGMFCWSARAMAAAVREFAPGLEALLKAPAEAEDGREGGNAALAARLDALYPTLPKISVDYAIMERHRNVVMARGTFDWDDVGSWNAAAKYLKDDGKGNAIGGGGQVKTLDSAGNIVVADEGRTVALLGVEGLVVVQHGDALLVCGKERAQELKKLLAK